LTEHPVGAICQLEKYVSWRSDLNEIGMDALQLPWDNYSGYVFPPFYLIGRCLRKVREERAPLVLIAPVWKSKLWYTVLLELLVEYPLVIQSIYLL